MNVQSRLCFQLQCQGPHDPCNAVRATKVSSSLFHTFCSKNDNISHGFVTFVLQFSFYPKYPSDVNTPFDFTFMPGLHFQERSPDILFTPSLLTRFVKVFQVALISKALA
jgi:hypothetical protein